MTLPLKLGLLFTKPILGGRELPSLIRNYIWLRSDYFGQIEDGPIRKIDFVIANHPFLFDARNRNLGTHWLLQISSDDILFYSA